MTAQSRALAAESGDAGSDCDGTSSTHGAAAAVQKAAAANGGGSTSACHCSSDGTNSASGPGAGAVGPPYAALALSLCRQPWPDLGLDLDLLNDPPQSSAAAAETAKGVAGSRRSA